MALPARYYGRRQGLWVDISEVVWAKTYKIERTYGKGCESMISPSSNNEVLWEPSEHLKQQVNMTKYMQWLADEKGLRFSEREALWEWSVMQLEDFWASIWEYFHIKASHPYTSVLQERKMPGAKWFQGATLNYAEHVFRDVPAGHPALLFRSERHELVAVSWDELYQKVGAVAAALRKLG